MGKSGNTQLSFTFAAVEACLRTMSRNPERSALGHKQILARVRTICAFPGKRPSVIAGCPPCSMASSANRRRRLSVDLYFLPTSRICLLCARQCRTLSFASRPGCHKAPMAQVSFEPKADSRKWPIGTEATCHRKVKHGTEGKLLTAFSPSQCRAVLRGTAVRQAGEQCAAFTSAPSELN